MKKTLTLLLAIGCLFSLTACQKNIEEENKQIEYKREKAEANSENKVLIIYFSRYGNTKYTQDIDASTSASVIIEEGESLGATEYVANVIGEEVNGDLQFIETVNSYSTDFDEVIEENHKEINENYLPNLAEIGLDISQYDTIFIGYPVWATTVPQAIKSFLEKYDLNGKRIIPFCTHDGYGAGSSYTDIRSAEPDATVLDGISIEASDVVNSKEMILNWLNSVGFGDDDSEVIEITIEINGVELEGVLYNSYLVNQIKDKMPLTVSMSSFGGREYYGSIDFTPENNEQGQFNFKNGDITYCSQNNTMAIFYAQTDHPTLTMEVNQIGKVTSDLSLFDELSSSVEVTFKLK